MRLLVHRKARRIRGPKAVVRVAIHVAKGDMVQVVAGEHKGKRARVLRVHPKSGRVTLEGVNLVKKHLRANNPGGESGIIERAAPIHHSNVMLIDPKTGEPTRIRRKIDKDGTVERIAVKSGQSIPRNR
jgi:large subunit ribosomal protein L24